jgi:16S rRNA (guanine966-N2)-methyltransferase
VREAIFDLIGHRLEGAKVVDLFAGTGSLGIEALSRGAAWALFVDDSPKAVALIGKNLGLCGLQEQGVIVRKDLLKGLPRTHRLVEEKADLVFLDPPYRKGMILPVLKAIIRLEMLESHATVVAQSDHREALPPRVGGLETVKSRVYGDTRITLYRREGRE